MNKTEITPFAKISVRHSFFESGLMENLAIKPTFATKTFMRKMGIYDRSSEGEILLAGADLVFDKIKDLEDTPCLRFIGMCSDPQVLGYSDVPVFSAREQVLAFNIFPKQPASADLILMHEAASAGANDLLGIIQGDQIEIGNAGEVKLISFADRLDSVVLECKIELHDGGRLVLDKSVLPDGIYKQQNGVVASEYSCYLSGPQNPFVFIELFMTAAMLTAWKNSDSLPLGYEVLIGNRSNFWRYYIVDVQKRDASELRIIDTLNDVEFSLPKK